MKVLVLSHLYPSTFNEVAGIFVHQQAKALIEKGIEVRVVSPVPWAPFPINWMSRKWKAYSEIPTEAVWDKIKVQYPRYLTFPKGWLFASSGQRMRLGIRDVVARIYQEFSFDLIHAHVALPDGYAGALFSKCFGRPLVVTIHGQDLQSTVNRNAGCRRAVSLVLALASRTILVSHKLERLAAKHFIFNDRLVVVPNGVNPQIAVSRSLEPLDQQKKAPILLSVSNLVPTKGIDFNLYAIQRMQKKYPALRYLVIGAGPEEKKLRKLTAELGLEKQVWFLGRQPHNKVIRHMANCDIFTLPSWNEGFGVVYLEAMATGKPVIGCQGEGIEDFVQHGKTGLLAKPRDVDSLVELLDFLLSNPNNSKVIGERACKLVLENYTWEKNADKIIKVYEEVLSGS